MTSEHLFVMLDRRPAGADDSTMHAVGKLSGAAEWLECARGRLYDFPMGDAATMCAIPANLRPRRRGSHHRCRAPG